MPKIQRRDNETSRIMKLKCDDNQDRFLIRYTCQKTPDRQSIELSIENEEFGKQVTVVLDSKETQALRDVVNSLYPAESSRVGLRRGSNRGSDHTLKLECDSNGDSFVVHYTNQGEPFREGIQIGIENIDFDKEVLVMLEDREAMALVALLNMLFPIDK